MQNKTRKTLALMVCVTTLASVFAVTVLANVKVIATDESVSEVMILSWDGSTITPFYQLGYIDGILMNYGHASVEYTIGNPAPSVKVGHLSSYNYSGYLVLDLDLPQAIELSSITGIIVQVDMLIKLGDPSRQNKFAASDAYGSFSDGEDRISLFDETLSQPGYPTYPAGVYAPNLLPDFPFPAKGVWHTLTIEKFGDRVTYRIDNTTVNVFQEDRIGKVITGMRIWFGDVPGPAWYDAAAVACWDNLLVKTVTRPMPISVTIDIDPNRLNLRSMGKWITVYIEPPEGHDMNCIDVSTIMLNDTIPAESFPTCIQDFDGDGVLELKVKFSRMEVIDYVEDKVEGKFTIISLTLTGDLSDGTSFEGSDVLTVFRSVKGGPGIKVYWQLDGKADNIDFTSFQSGIRSQHIPIEEQLQLVFSRSLRRRHTPLRYPRTN